MPLVGVKPMADARPMPSADAQEKLADAGDQERPAGAEELFQIDLQSDDEKEQNQADLGNKLDGVFVLDPGETDLRADDHAGD